MLPRKNAYRKVIWDKRYLFYHKKIGRIWNKC